MKKLPIKILFLALLITGCGTKSDDFTLSFTMESIDTYRLSIAISQNRTYIIQQQNLLFDAFAGKEQINTSQRTLNEEEFSELKSLIAASRLFKMKDSYGFNKEPDDSDPFSDMIYQINYTENHKTKNITIRVDSKDLYPEKFLQLIQFLTSLSKAE